VSEEENIAIVRQAIRHLNETGEPDWDLYDAELVWTSRPDGPAHITYRGLDGLRRGVASMRGVWAEFKAEIEEITASEDRVVSVLRWHLRAQSGVELEEVEGWASWLRDGKITRIEQHGSKREALEATGLRE
jgi:ketosteroid isomerase-like protein